MIIDSFELREKVGVFADRADAGEQLAELLNEYKDSDLIVLSVPDGGVPVGAVIAKQLNLQLEVLVVSKITYPFNTEAGFGAVAFDGTMRLREDIAEELSDQQIKAQSKEAVLKVQRRVKKFKGIERAGLEGKRVIVVDDGIATGFTLRVGIEALKNASVSEIILAVPTAHAQSLAWLEKEVERIYCSNIRSGYSYAVASAYRKWYDVAEDEALGILKGFGSEREK